ncbi:hypothetical protein [Parvibacter caecicola]|uniref:Uncharacterized protein n=1 Tax=Parvibacter caecicola TaxID=747645 RepID=A0A7W5GQU0_9ACTN|nr:hypothetical protein [Parvibacter caecicola]MBB3171809.1 hypothetical protein [Parvibacter caecicola]MCR2040632.1 hypothetical protein [Parvibacter caecicola]RNL10811.1 hypothetical protein DMP11_06075 [Parvibacter caecicola]
MMEGSLHLITAHAGEPHISPENDARYNAGTLGPASYVLPTKSKMACTLIDSNTVRVLGGDAVCCGYRWAVAGDYAEVNIDNGIPGYNRVDLIVAHIETYPDYKCELRAIKGEETTGTAVVPGHIEGDLNAGDTVAEMPICSVAINGINPQEPKMLLQESHTIEGLYADLSKQINDVRDSLSQVIQEYTCYTNEGESTPLPVIKRVFSDIPTGLSVVRAVWSRSPGFDALCCKKPNGVFWALAVMTETGKMYGITAKNDGELIQRDSSA